MLDSGSSNGGGFSFAKIKAPASMHCKEKKTKDGALAEA
jgi:hypothetical protein